MSLTDPADERRLAALYVSPDILAGLFKAGTRFTFPHPDGERVVTVDKGLPADADVVGVSYDPATHRVALVARSAEFAPVPVGRPLPPLDGRVRQETLPHARDSQ